MALRPIHLQRALVIVHLLGLALMFGGTAAVLALTLTGEPAGPHRTIAFEHAWRLQNLVLLPGAVAVAGSGVLMSATGPFGFFKYRWVVVKLVGSVILAFHSQVEYRPLTGHLHALLNAGAELPADFGDQLFHFHRVGVIQLVVLVALSLLGVFKPWGRTRFGRAPTPST